MAGQGVNIGVQNVGVGGAVGGAAQQLLVIGCSSGGSANAPFTSTQPSAFQANFGTGQGPELAAFITNETGNQVTFVKATTVTPGSNSTLYATPGNGGTATPSLTGTPYDEYYLLVTCLTAGTLGTAPGPTLGFSLDGGATNQFQVSLGTNLAVGSGSGLTSYSGLTFTAGSSGQTWNLGDSYYAVCTAPLWSDATVYSAIQAAVALKAVVWQDVLVPGIAFAADATAIDGYMQTLANTSKRPVRCLLAARDIVWGGTSTESQASWTNALVTAFSNVATVRTGVCAGHYRFVSPLSQSQFRRSLLWGAGARDSGVPYWIDLAQVSDGSLENLVLPAVPDSFAGNSFVYQDSDISPNLNAARFLTAWQIVNLPGAYVMNSNLMVGPGQPPWLQQGHVIDQTFALAYQYFVQVLSSPVRVSAKTGTILPQDANRIQTGMNNQLNAFIINPGGASYANCVVSLTDLILTTSTLTVTIEVVPLGYIKTINVTIVFTNPAVALAA